MKNVLTFPNRIGSTDLNRELLASIAVLREVVGQLSERIEVLEARAALGAAGVPVKN
jgi:hypothetical protein